MYIERKALVRSLSYAAKFTGDLFTAEFLQVIRLSAPDGASALDVWATNGRDLFMDSIPLDTMTHFAKSIFIHVDHIKDILAALRGLKSSKLEILHTANGLTFGGQQHHEQYTAPLCDNIATMPWDAMVDLVAGAEIFTGIIPAEGMLLPIDSFRAIMPALAAYTSNDTAPILRKVRLPGKRRVSIAFEFSVNTLRIICMSMRADADNSRN